MNLGEIREQIAFVVDFSGTSVDQDFAGPSTDTNKYIDYAINQAYREEVNLGKQNGSRDAFKKKYNFTWEANEQYYSPPAFVRDADILAVQDNSHQNPGPIISLFDELVEGSGMYKEDRDTWGQYPIPGSDRSLTIIYLANPLKLVHDGDVPELMASQYHDLIVWSAAVLLRTVSDEQAPQQWLMRRQNLRHEWWKFLSMGSPMLYPPKRIRNDNPDITELF